MAECAVTALNCKRSTATTGLGSIGVGETEAPGIQPVFPMDIHAMKINSVGWVHDKRKSARFKDFILRFLLIKAQNIGKTRTSTTLYPDAQVLTIPKARFAHEPLDFQNSLGTELKRGHRHCFHLVKLPQKAKMPKDQQDKSRPSPLSSIVVALQMEAVRLN